LQGVNLNLSIMAEETTPTSPSEDASEQAAAPAAPKAKRAKATATATAATAEAKAPKKAAVEDKPFADFINQDYLPALDKAFTTQNVRDLKLSFVNNQVTGQWQNGQRQFSVYFTEANLNSQRAFSCSTGKAVPSTLEPFLGDERKITLDLLVFGVMQRLNAQKWFGNN
jgi:pyruvate/2-oxoglutarate dehydrogenase complex dihydrolipoamide acyltransferase (E2) component